MNSRAVLRGTVISIVLIVLIGVGYRQYEKWHNEKEKLKREQKEEENFQLELESAISRYKNGDYDALNYNLLLNDSNRREKYDTDQYVTMYHNLCKAHGCIKKCEYQEALDAFTSNPMQIADSIRLKNICELCIDVENKMVHMQYQDAYDEIQSSNYAEHPALKKLKNKIYLKSYTLCIIRNYFSTYTENELGKFSEIIWDSDESSSHYYPVVSFVYYIADSNVRGESIYGKSESIQAKYKSGEYYYMYNVIEYDRSMMDLKQYEELSKGAELISSPVGQYIKIEEYIDPYEQSGDMSRGDLKSF